MVYHYQHTVAPLTVGQLRELLTGMEDSVQVQVVVPTGPSTECGIGDEPPLVLTGSSGDWTVEESSGRPVLTLNADYPSGAYQRLDDGRHVPDRGK